MSVSQPLTCTKSLPVWRLHVIYFLRVKKNAVINKEDDLLITAVVIHYITCVLKHITYPGVVSVKVLLIKILKC